MSVSNDDEVRGWFSTLSEKFEKMQGLMDYEQDDSDDFLEIVEDLEEIITAIKDYFESKDYPVPRAETPPHEKMKKTEK
jgi:hypothetical protein